MLLLLERGICEPGMAAKLAGRLSHTVTQSADRLGRAFIGPCYAQQHSPLAFNRIGIALHRAMLWFINYLLMRLPVVRMRPKE